MITCLELCMFNNNYLYNLPQYQGTMDLGKKLALYFGSIAVGSMGGLGAINLYAHHNVVSEYKDFTVFEKADGILGFTMAIVRKNEIKIKRLHALDYKSWEDTNLDGKVDSVYIPKSISPRGQPEDRIYIRDKDIKRHPEVFEKADIEFREQMQRFGLHSKLDG